MLASYIHYLGSVVAGCCSGLVYGLLFTHQKKGALLNSSYSNCLQSWARQLIATTARLTAFSVFIWYLLPLPKIHLILGMMSFLALFWVMVTRYAE